MLGYAGGFVGPLVVGMVLDASGGMSPQGWMAAYFVIAGLMGLALVLFWLMQPRGLEGDQISAVAKAPPGSRT